MIVKSFSNHQEQLLPAAEPLLAFVLVLFEVATAIAACTLLVGYGAVGLVSGLLAVRIVCCI